MELISSSSLGNTVINIHKQIQKTQLNINQLQNQLNVISDKEQQIRNNYNTQVQAVYAECTKLYVECHCFTKTCSCPPQNPEYAECNRNAATKRQELLGIYNQGITQVQQERAYTTNQIGSAQTAQQSYINNFEELTGVAYTDFIKAVEISDRNNLSLNDVFPSLAARLNIIDPTTIQQVIAPSTPAAQIQPPIQPQPIEKTMDTVIEEKKQTEAVVSNVSNNMPVLGIIAAGAFVLGAAIFGGKR